MAATPSTLAYLADAERQGALGHTLTCSCDLCCYRSWTTENTENR